MLEVCSWEAFFVFLPPGGGIVNGWSSGLWHCLFH